MKRKSDSLLNKYVKLSTLHSILQTVLLCFLVYRVEGIHKQLHQISTLFANITGVLSDQILGAMTQFQMAIDSILSLFGGSES